MLEAGCVSLLLPLRYATSSIADDSSLQILLECTAVTTLSFAELAL